jgi:hypothetical protein
MRDADTSGVHPDDPTPGVPPHRAVLDDPATGASTPGATLLVGDRPAVETWLADLVHETGVAVAIATSPAARSWWTDTDGRVDAVVDATASDRTRHDAADRVVYRPSTRPDTSAVLATCGDVLDDLDAGAIVVDGVAPFVATDLKSGHRMVHALDSVARFAGGRLVVTMDPTAVAPHVVTLFSYGVDETVTLDET